MKRVRALSERERALWAHVARTVLPIRRGVAPATMPMEVLLDALDSEAEQAANPEAGLQSVPVIDKPRSKTIERNAKAPPLAPIERRLRQQLSRGQRSIDAKIDLHGLRQDEAHAALMQFIERAHHAEASLVLVVTGKGGGNKGSVGTGSRDRKSERGAGEFAFAEPSERSRGVLNRLVPLWLANPAARRFVIGFETAAANHGGSGALYVRIRKSRN